MSAGFGPGHAVPDAVAAIIGHPVTGAGGEGQPTVLWRSSPGLMGPTRTAAIPARGFTSPPHRPGPRQARSAHLTMRAAPASRRAGPGTPGRAAWTPDPLFQ